MLVAVGLVIRLKIAETPAFAKVVEERGTTKAPLVEVFRRHPKEMLLGAGMITVVYVMFYTAATYCMTYTTDKLGIPKNDMLGLTLVAVVVLGVCTFLVARWSDRVGQYEYALLGRRILLQPRRCAGRCGRPADRDRAAEAYSPSVGGWFMSAMALVSLVCILALPETSERDLYEV